MTSVLAIVTFILATQRTDFGFNKCELKSLNNVGYCGKNSIFHTMKQNGIRKIILYHSEKNYFYITVKKTIFISQCGKNKCTYLVMNTAILFEFLHVVGDCADGGYFFSSIQPFPHSLGTSWAIFIAQSYHFNSATILNLKKKKSQR